MPRVPSAAEAAEKWSRVSRTRAVDYEAGIKDPGVDWERSTTAARESYEAGVQDAIAQGRFTKGVSAKGNDGWRNNTVGKGVSRWPQGVAAGQSAMEQGMGPVLQTIERTTLPPRRPRGDPQNVMRVSAIADALSAQRKRG